MVGGRGEGPSKVGRSVGGSVGCRVSMSNLQGISQDFLKSPFYLLVFITNETVEYIKSKLLGIHSFALKICLECQEPPGQM